MSILVLEHSDRCRCGRLASALRDHGHVLDIRRLNDGDSIPEDLEGIDGIISAGGPMAPDDDSHAWMNAEIECLSKAIDLDLPVLGICLGCQLLARALGGSVHKRPSGTNIGWQETRLTPEGREDRLFAGLPWNWTTAFWNSWQVDSLPKDAQVLASNQDGDVHAWRHGVRTYAYQFHPEVSPAILENWIDDEPDVLQQAGTTKAEVMGRTEAEWPSFERLTERLFKACALLLFPLEQRSIGTGKVREVHH
ncbi:MAG: type 1 glutamine amidotransferase [Phycisphaerales bacterium]|nr:type 1 glutamine amidotransferase [Phycisphaerales bacterium]